ncbi:MAG: hypothetical protein MJZ76_08480 [Bacteroidales bacterium]|nr:hypothetical protein [Bacteroidales bacterium]
MGCLLGSSAVVIFFVIVFFWDLLVAIMARKRGRSGLGWFIVSLFTSPLLSMIVLLCIGDRE